MNPQKDPIPFDDLARLNEGGAMVKLVAAPFAVIAGVLVLIWLIRLLQKARERQLTRSSWD